MDLSTYFTYIFLLCCCLVSQLCLTFCDPMDLQGDLFYGVFYGVRSILWCSLRQHIY